MKLKRILSGIASVSLCIGVLSGCQAAAPVKETITEASSTEENVFEVPRAQDDFYGYVNAQNLIDISTDYGYVSAGAFDDIGLQVDEQLQEIITSIAYSDDEYEPGSNEQMIRDLYLQCLSYDRETEGSEVFEEVFANIDACESIEDLLSTNVELGSQYGIFAVPAYELQVNPYDTSEYLVCTSIINSFLTLETLGDTEANISNAYDQVSNLLINLGYDYDTSTSSARSIIQMLTSITNVTDYDVLMNNEVDEITNLNSIDELDDMLTNIDVASYLELCGFDTSEISEINVFSVEQIQAINDALTLENLETWKMYTKCCFLAGFSSYMPDYYATSTSTNYVDTERFAFDVVNSTLPIQVGEEFVERYYTEEISTQLEAMCADIKVAYIDMINNCEWLSSSGKVSMIEKFNNITFCLGGPEAHEINASDALLIGDSLFETIRNIKANEAFEHIQKLNEAPDLLEWDMAPQTVNACFSPPANAIFITAAILNAPFFDLNSDYYTNLGGLGAVICHELSHAFDPKGMEYDSSGNYNPEWVSQEDRDNLDAIQSSVIDYYNDFTILEVYHVDGELTACENLADIGSVQCILSMCNNEDDIRALFINYACIWEMLFHDNVILESLTEDVHSPASTRVNAVVSCFDEFYEIFDVSEGDQMYVRPENRVRRW